MNRIHVLKPIGATALLWLVACGNGGGQGGGGGDSQQGGGGEESQGGGGGAASCVPHVASSADPGECFAADACDQLVQGGGAVAICTAGCERDEQCSSPARCFKNEFGGGACLLPCDGGCEDPLVCEEGFCNVP